MISAEYTTRRYPIFLGDCGVYFCVLFPGDDALGQHFPSHCHRCLIVPKFLFISNYFLRFSNEYKRVHGEKSLNRNNWYEYVEYGTTNEVTIQLQRYGFSRESATYIKAHPQYFTVDGEGNVHVKNDLENCGDNEVVQQIPDIRFNTPELFVE